MVFPEPVGEGTKMWIYVSLFQLEFFLPLFVLDIGIQCKISFEKLILLPFF